MAFLKNLSFWVGLSIHISTIKSSQFLSFFDLKAYYFHYFTHNIFHVYVKISTHETWEGMDM